MDIGGSWDAMMDRKWGPTVVDTLYQIEYTVGDIRLPLWEE